MKTTEETCPSRTVTDGEWVRCHRDPGHPSVHLGRVRDDDARDGNYSEALHQWTDADAIRDESDARDDDLPVWYRVLPLGKPVQVSPIGDDFRVVSGDLLGVVLDDHEQPAALVVREDTGDGTVQRHLFPWHHVGAVRWDESQA